MVALTSRYRGPRLLGTCPGIRGSHENTAQVWKITHLPTVSEIEGRWHLLSGLIGPGGKFESPVDRHRLAADDAWIFFFQCAGSWVPSAWGTDDVQLRYVLLCDPTFMPH